MTDIQNNQTNQNAQAQPKKADVDELLKQLEALNQEIAAKTVDNKPQLEEKKDEAEKLEAPVVAPAIESSDELQLPVTNETNTSPTPELKQEINQPNDQEKTQAKDLDLDNFINELETKITEKNDGEVQKKEPSQQVESIKEQPESIKEQPQQQKPVTTEENFARQRPSLDLSIGGEEDTSKGADTTPSLTLNNGQLEENKNEVEKPATTEAANEEDLESQNIFSMLGLDNLENSEKEGFLADLEKLIWDNFIEVELPLLLNSEEKAQADRILADNAKTEPERKEELLVYVEKFIPNLEEIMYKKALTLKKEMFEERMKKMRQQATEKNNLSLVADLDQIQELIVAGRYKTATELLNKA